MTGPSLVDLTHPLYAGMPHATTIPEPRFDQVRDYDLDGLRCMQVSLPTHCGTHLDAPSHFLAEGSTIDEVPLTVLIGPALCVEVYAREDQPITADDLVRATPLLDPGDALLIRTGWDEKYGRDGYLHHPYLSVGAARWLADQRLRLLGIDTITPELPGPMRPDGYPCPVHKTLLAANVYILENLDLRRIASHRCELFIGALTITGGDGAPARVLARMS